MDRPMPRLAPVTSTVFPVMSICMDELSSLGSMDRAVAQ
jgi:hypothetical protein